MGQSRRPHERVAHDQLSSLLLRQPLESAPWSEEEGGVIRSGAGEVPARRLRGGAAGVGR